MSFTAEQAADLKSLELLYDYTKFHIGVYLTMATTFIAIANIKKGDSLLLDLRPGFVLWAVGMLLVAGFAGGVIVSSITQCYSLVARDALPACSSAAAFLKAEHGPWHLTAVYVPGLYWTWLEHTSFWLGLGFALLSFKSVKPPAALRSVKKKTT